MVGQCCVYHSNCNSMLCQTVRGLFSWVFNCPMVRLCFIQLSKNPCSFKLSNACTVLCLIVQWLDSAVSFCPSVKCLDSAVSSSPSIVLQYNSNLHNSKMVWKDSYIAVNCLGGCRYKQYFDVLQNVPKHCAFCRTVWDSTCYYIRQFQIFCAPAHDTWHVQEVNVFLFF